MRTESAANCQSPSRTLTYQQPTLDLTTLKIDTVVDHRAYSVLASDVARAQFCEKMQDARASWASFLRKRPVDDVLHWIRFPEEPAMDWRTAVLERGISAEDFERRGSFLYHELAAEATAVAMRRIGILRAMSRDLGKDKKILVYGAGVGTYMYPWAEHEHDITSVVRAESWSTLAFKRRMRQDFVDHDRREVGAAWYESGLRARYDVVVCLDLLNRVAKPLELAEYLSTMADILILSVPGSTPTTPWTVSDDQRPMSALADRLVGNGARRARKTLDPSCTWSSDLLIFR